MPLVPAVMQTNIVAALNATGKFTIAAGDPTYNLIGAICQAFVPVWMSMSVELAPGTGPPPAGVYPHAHSFLGVNLIALTNTYQMAIFAITSIPGSGFQVPPQPPGQTSLLFFTQCWAQELMKVVDSVQLTSNVADGAIAHDHRTVIIPPPPNNTHWATLSTPAQIQALATTITTNMENCLILKHGATKFKPSEPLSEFHGFAMELSKSFLTEIKNNSMMLPMAGAGHIHVLA